MLNLCFCLSRNELSAFCALSVWLDRVMTVNSFHLHAKAGNTFSTHDTLCIRLAQFFWPWPKPFKWVFLTDLSVVFCFAVWCAYRAFVLCFVLSFVFHYRATLFIAAISRLFLSCLPFYAAFSLSCCCHLR